jgi:hypothetical protein
VDFELPASIGNPNVHIRVGVMATEPFDWSEYQKLADELARRPEESCLRTAIGRAYYYVFHLAKKRVEANGFYIIRGADTHK